MKSVAIFLALVFLTGFQAAVLNEEPPPSIQESNQSFLNQFKEQLGKFSGQVTDSVNGGLEAIKERASDLVAFTIEFPNSKILHKVMTRRLGSWARDAQVATQALYTQSKEMMKDHLKKVAETVEEMKKNPTIVMMNEEMIQPMFNKCTKFINLASDQSLASMYNTIQKKFH